MKDSNSIVRPFVLSVLWLCVLLFISQAAHAQACVVPPSGIMSWWPGDGNANDIQGDNDGLLHNGVTFTTGIVEQAFSFDGVDDFVEVTNEASFDFERTDAFTIEAWIKTSSDEILNIVSKMSDSPPSRGFQLIKHRSSDGFLNRLHFFLTHSQFGTASDNMIRLSGTTDITDGNWHHLAVTYDGSSTAAGVLMYVDGVLEPKLVTHDNLTETIQNDLPLQISGREGSNTVFNGLIEEVAIFDRVLSLTEIQAIYTAGSAGKCKPILLPVELVSIEAVADADAVVLSWRTASETNNAGFELQHASVGVQRDAPTFEPIAFVEGHGTTATPQTYTYRVEALEPGPHRFRLKQLDFDGSFAYSPEVEVFVALPEAFVLTAAYPNPFKPSTSFSLMVKRRQQVEVAIYDALGRLVRTLYRGTMEAEQARAIVFEASDLPNGLYVIRALGETFVATRKVMLIK